MTYLVYVILAFTCQTSDWGLCSQEKVKKKNRQMYSSQPIGPNFPCAATILHTRDHPVFTQLTHVLKRQATTIHQHKHDLQIINAGKVRSLLRGLGSLEVEHGGCHEQQHIHNHPPDKAPHYRPYAETHRPEEEASSAVFSQQHFFRWATRARRCR